MLKLYKKFLKVEHKPTEAATLNSSKRRKCRNSEEFKWITSSQKELRFTFGLENKIFIWKFSVLMPHFSGQYSQPRNSLVAMVTPAILNNFSLFYKSWNLRISISVRLCNIENFLISKAFIIFFVD